MRVDVRTLPAGPALDWLVAKAAGIEVEIHVIEPGRIWLTRRGWKQKCGLVVREDWRPSSDWRDIGPLINQLGLSLLSFASGQVAAVRRQPRGGVTAEADSAILALCRAAALPLADGTGHAEVPGELAVEVAT